MILTYLSVGVGYYCETDSHPPRQECPLSFAEDEVPFLKENSALPYPKLEELRQFNYILNYFLFLIENKLHFAWESKSVEAVSGNADGLLRTERANINESTPCR